MKRKWKQLMGILLSFLMVLELMPGMSLKVYADDPYAALKNTTTAVKFANRDWYLIDYNSSTVTLLSKDCIGASMYDANGESSVYENSTIQTFVNNWYSNNISNEDQSAVSGGMFLLTTEQAQNINQANSEVLKCDKADGAEANIWWLGSRGYYDDSAACVHGDYGYVRDDGIIVMTALVSAPL